MDTAVKFKKIDYLLLFLLIGVSVIPILKTTVGIYGTLVCLLFVIRRWYFTPLEIIFLIIALGLEIYHNIAFNGYDVLITRQVIIFFIFAILTVNCLKMNLLPMYINILYYLTLISFVFFGLYHVDKGVVKGIANMFPSIFKTFSISYEVKNNEINPIFYNFDTNNFFKLGRNNGPFWEPTIFAIMLIIAQIFNLLLTKKLFNKKGIVFSLGILTTISTTCFLAYFIIIIGYFLSLKNVSVLTKTLLVSSMVMISLVLFSSLPFLGAKIQDEISNMDKSINQTEGDSRVASAFLDVSELIERTEYVLWGKGSTKSIRTGGDDKNALRNCGDTALLVEWGIFFFVLYFGLMYYSFRSLVRLYGAPKYYPAMFLIVFLICGFSEVIFDQAFFHIFLFFGTVISRNKIKL